MEYTDEFGAWWEGLSGEEQERVRAAVLVLERNGPALGRPWVDGVKGSRHRNLKELRPRGGFIRILFAFDARRTAILLIGGDKAHRWQSWYVEMLPIADRLYDEHLEEIEREQRITATDTTS